MLPYVDISLGNTIAVTRTVGAGDNQVKKIESNMRIVKAVNVCFINPQMYRRFVSEKINVWVPENLSLATVKEFEEQGLRQGINEIISLTAIQPPWQEKFEPSDVIYMTTEQLFSLVELLNPTGEQLTDDTAEIQ
jgi:hypothetical protein